MSDKVGRSKDAVKWMYHGSVQESSATRYWFLTLSIISFALTLIVPLGCLSPATQAFALFSVNPKILVEKYQSRMENTTNTARNYSRESLEADLLLIPDIYRVGMSGVCREFHNSSEPMRCTKLFPQTLDLGALIDEDLNKTHPSATFRSLWSSLIHDDSQPIVQHQARTTSFTKASGGITITSLVIAPLGFSIILLLFLTDRPSYNTVAKCVALLDAAFVLLAAGLWISASVMYAVDIQSAVPKALGDTTSFWGTTNLFPASNGLSIFAFAAFAKLIVLPVMAFICLIIFLLFVAAAVLMAVLMWMALACMLAMLGVCSNTTTTTEQVWYGSQPIPDWANPNLN